MARLTKRERRARRVVSRWDRHIGVVMIAAGVFSVGWIALIPARHPPMDFSRLEESKTNSLRGAGDPAFRQTKWEELIPAGWNPSDAIKVLQQRGKALNDGDPQAISLLSKRREILNNAPTNPAMDKASVDIPGYVVPLDQNENGTSEFLLVPYFGACIHTPPPPSNQIIHVWLASRAKGFRTMDTVWVEGILHIRRADSAMGSSGYVMDANHINKYVSRP